MEGRQVAGTGTAALRRVGRLSSGAALAVAALAAALVLAPAVLGWQRYAIVSGSMSGTYDRGSLVLDEVVPVADLEVGDVMTYQPPAGGRAGLITHRIAWIGRDDAGRPLYRTKGDANPVADPWTFRLDQPTQARVRLGVPYVGYALSALGRRDVRMAAIALPALLIAGFSLGRLWRALGAEAQRRALEGTA
jgi:signal peptidase